MIRRVEAALIMFWSRAYRKLQKWIHTISSPLTRAMVRLWPFPFCMSSPTATLHVLYTMSANVNDPHQIAACILVFCLPSNQMNVFVVMFDDSTLPARIVFVTLLLCSSTLLLCCFTLFISFYTLHEIPYAFCFCVPTPCARSIARCITLCILRFVAVLHSKVPIIYSVFVALLSLHLNLHCVRMFDVRVCFYIVLWCMCFFRCFMMVKLLRVFPLFFFFLLFSCEVWCFLLFVFFRVLDCVCVFGVCYL